MESITKKAYAKINLGLDVTGVRPNGYHDVSMVMQTIDIFDEVTVSLSDSDEITMEIPEISPGVLPEGETLSPGTDNLCAKAASLLMKDAGVSRGLDILLKKNTPIAAGLGGGSSDAAAVLIAVNELLELGYDLEKLAELAVGIGADVPYCLYGNTMHAAGIGEVLTEIKGLPELSLVISRPNVPVSTGSIYKKLDAIEDPVHPDIDALIASIEAGSVEGTAKNAGNILELVTIPEHPEISRIKELMVENGALSSRMSGSGPSVFGIFPDSETAEKCVTSLKNEFPDCYAVNTKTINR